MSARVHTHTLDKKDNSTLIVWYHVKLVFCSLRDFFLFPFTKQMTKNSTKQMQQEEQDNIKINQNTINSYQKHFVKS